MSLQYPLSRYAEKPFHLDGVSTVVECLENRGSKAYGDYRLGDGWPSQSITADTFYSAGRVMREPNERIRKVFAVSATATVDSLRHSAAIDDELAARCVRNLVEEPDAFAPVDHSTHPDVGRGVVEEIYEMEVAHNPNLAELVTGIEIAFTPSFDHFMSGKAREQLLQTEAIADAARLGVGYGAAMTHNAWEAGLTDYAVFPDGPLA